jgi:UDP-glucose 4-epimerase
MRVLITGGAGFIAHHLTKLFLDHGDHVTAVDDLSTGSYSNVREFLESPKYTFIYGTCLDAQLMAPLVDEADVVYHMAAAVGVELIIKSPVKTIETNVHGTETILQLCAKKSKRVFIFSTSEVYGKTSKIPFCEEDDLVLGPPTKGRWSYACSKLLDEFLGLAYWSEQGTPVTVVRLFNTIGPYQTGRYGMVAPRFVKQALAGEPVTVYGTGLQTRCFGHVEDICKALFLLLDTEGTVGEVYNIGNPEEVSILELAKRVILLAKSDSEIVFVPYNQAYGSGFEDMPRRVPDVSKITQATGWRPTSPLKKIILDIVESTR